MFTGEQELEIASFLKLSARIGADPLLVQAGTGNTSIKFGHVMWIKASGKWLAHALSEDILTPVNISEVHDCVRRNVDIGEHHAACGGALRPSIETAMHAVIADRVVVHVHSVNTIAWAVRSDGAAHLNRLLRGLPWQWIPYVASGNDLARAIKKALAEDARTRIFVLANHGLVLSADSCEGAKSLLLEVERRVAIRPRPMRAPDINLLESLTRATGWYLPEAHNFHALGTDAISRDSVAHGVLYPCQAMFFGSRIPAVSSVADLTAAQHSNRTEDSLFAIVDGAGIILSRRATRTETAMLAGLVQVARRIQPPLHSLAYLTAHDVRRACGSDAGRYRALMESAQDVFPPSDQDDQLRTRHSEPRPSTREFLERRKIG